MRGDIPRALGIADLNSVNRVRDRSVYYCEPVGTDESICEMILDLARDTGLPFRRKSDGGNWPNFPRAGRRALLQALESERILAFGQVLRDSRARLASRQ